jgi:cell division protein FtsI (penicillin-binding protein 3)
VATLLVLVLFAAIGIRLVVLQVVQAPAYANGGVAARLRTVTLPASRGAIYDRSGVPLAHSLEARYVYADPELVKDPAAAATALSPLLGIPRSELAERMAKRKRPGGAWSNFEYLARGVDIETAKKITALDLDGIQTARDERREVPGGDLAANLIGFTGQDMNGLEGLEARYDELLRGVNGKHVYEAGRGDLGTAIPGGYNHVTEAQPGSSLALTIDRDLQYKVQQVLSQAMRNARGSKAAAVVLDRNGEVLAQASHPTYNAAAPLESDSTDREDVATSFVVDPGSVHKALVFGAALQEGVITPETVLPVPSSVVKGGRRFSDTHDAQGRRMSVPGMLGYSSNVGTIKIADALTPQRLYDYQRKFGLGEPTGVGVPGEASGRVLAPAEWSGSAYGSIPIGHSVDVTPLQMAAAYAAIANDGTWVQPHLVKETVAPDGKRTPAPAPKTRRVLSPENAAALRTMMEAVVTLPDGTGTKAGIAGYRVAGKTGTGKRIVDGRYAPGEVASFIGMAPADKPQYVIAVFAYTPGGGGGDVAAPAFREMMAFALRHYRVPPTGTTPPKFTVYPR